MGGMLAGGLLYYAAVMKSIPDLLRALTDASVQFVLVGGFAVQLHGFVPTTIDLDLVLAMDNDHLSRFIDVAKQFNLAPVIPVSSESLKNAAQMLASREGHVGLRLARAAGGG